MGLIKNGAIAEDTYRHVEGDAALPDGDIIVELSRFSAEREALLARDGKLGVKLASSDPPEALEGDLDGLSLVAIEFPKYADGRGYSTARLLRDRHGFGGELRAVGDVLRDQLLYTKRCGFDAYELKEGKDIEGALEAFGELTVAYQGEAGDSRALFRRRG